MTKPVSSIPDAVYHRVFQQDGDGAAILTELATLYHDRSSFVAGQPDATAFNEGARSVVLYLMQRSGQGEG